MDKNDRYFRIGRWQWVLYALIAVLIIASIMRGQWGDIPEWEQCKESLFSQMITGACTPRDGFGPEPKTIILEGPGKSV